MNENLKKLEKIDLSLFYTLTLRRHGDIDLQGEMTSSLIAYCKMNLGIDEFKTTTSNYLEAITFDGVKITLT